MCITLIVTQPLKQQNIELLSSPQGLEMVTSTVNYDHLEDIKEKVM